MVLKTILVLMCKINRMKEEMERRPFIALSTGKDEAQDSGVKVV